MRHLRLAVFLPALILLSGCQLLTPAAAPEPPLTRIQGTLTADGNQWQLQACNSDTQYRLIPSTELQAQLQTLSADSPTSLFADISGTANTADHSFSTTQTYRLQAEGHGCDDPDFARLILRASGNEPAWSILQTPQGLIFNQMGEASLALPYLEEQLPDGSVNISTQANDQHLQLWITPQLCTDSMSGTLHHLRAQLQWNTQSFDGCAAFGALRN